MTMTGGFDDSATGLGDVAGLGGGFGKVCVLTGRLVAWAVDELTEEAGCVDAVVEPALLVTDFSVARCLDDVDVQAAVNATKLIVTIAKGPARADRIISSRYSTVCRGSTNLDFPHSVGHYMQILEYTCRERQDSVNLGT